MSISPTLTSPSARATGLVSCMRFRQRINVDLPQPDGPMTAVAWFDSTEILMPCRASVFPNQAFRSRTSTAVGIKLTGPSQHTPQEYESHNRGGPNNKDDQKQCPCPRLPVPVVIRRICECVNLQRQCGNRLVGAETPELIAKCGEHQRRRLP